MSDFFFLNFLLICFYVNYYGYRVDKIDNYQWLTKQKIISISIEHEP